MSRVYNFSPGPCQLPEEVLMQAQRELLDWNHTGMSAMEIPHRSRTFEELAAEIKQDLVDLLNIPSNYEILLLHGGGRSQFGMIPMNLARGYNSIAYVQTGSWSQFAIDEAKRYGTVHIAGTNAGTGYLELPQPDTWDIPEDAAYVYYVDNETIQGIEYQTTPETGDIPLITDMSSNLLTRPLDVTKYGLIFACAQKNIGPAGVTFVIIRKDLLDREPFDFTPTMYRYTVHAKENSMYNTPATFNWYMAGLMFKWLKRQGGLEEMAKQNAAKTMKLYNLIDESNFYVNKVNPICRSRMNVVFQLANEELNATFLEEATKGGLTNLKGHRSVGGMRASIYNPMPELGVDTLMAFMRDFEGRFG